MSFMPIVLFTRLICSLSAGIAPQARWYSGAGDIVKNHD